LIRTLESGVNVSPSQSLEFKTVEVISRDSVSLSADLKNEYLDFARQHDWKESNNSVFRVNTAESYEALNLKSNGKNKSCSNASECPTILIRTLESGVNVSPCGKTNFPCSSSVAIILEAT
jgi:hypothetical protein